MKITKKTLNILSTFISMNPTFLFQPGNLVATTNARREGSKIVPVKSILVSAEVEEEFPKECAIFDLKQLLQIIGNFEDPEIEFLDNYLTITEGGNSIRYSYCDSNIVAFPNANVLEVKKIDETFILEKVQLDKIKKIASVLKNEDVIIKGDGEKITISIFNTNDSSTQYNFEIEKESDYKFEFLSSIDCFMLMNDSYTVNIGQIASGRSALILESLGETHIKYFVALRNPN
jgi:hypothetical protein